MGRPGRLSLRTGIRGNGGQISLNNYVAFNLAKELAEKLNIASASLNYMSNMDLFSKYISKRKDIDVDGFIDIIAHGNSNNILLFVNGKNILVNHRTLAKLIKNNYKDKKINGVRLLSCNTGAKEDGFAQRLADKLHIPVIAPNKYAFARLDGTHFVAGSKDNGKHPDYNDLGEYKIFYPRRFKK